MMARRTAMAAWFVALLAACGATVALGGPVDPATGLDLQGTLEKGLRVQRPEEFRFVADVAALVDQGLLPERLVKGTFQWARRKPRHQVQYFERGLVLQARKRGIPLNLGTTLVSRRR